MDFAVFVEKPLVIICYFLKIKFFPLPPLATFRIVSVFLHSFAVKCYCVLFFVFIYLTRGHNSL